MLLPTATSLQVVMLVNGLVHLLRAVGPRHALKGLYRASVGALLVDLGLLINEERGGFVEGANDNATAVACLLGLGAHLQQHPLQQTEVWLAFTGAEEVGCLGIHKLLDTHGQDLHDAWFLDFEMVGAGDVAYVTRHSAAGLLNGYKPDPHSAALADKVARQHPEYRVTGRDMTIFEEVGALRKRDYRGLCLVGVGQDGWLVNWHQYSDTAENIDTETLERAARFAWEMMQSLDE
jgi:Zn-dependent M28 family amino/carboxypeptidase